MIAMFIIGIEKREIQCIYQCSKELAGRWSEEYWEILSFQTEQELLQIIHEKGHADIICMDITSPKGVEFIKQLREQNPTSYVILVADTKISPITYMRPSIGAESLMLKPLTRNSVKEIMTEAFRAFLKRFYDPDESRVFVIDSKEGRTLIPYDTINYFEARDKRVYLSTNTREYGFYDTLERLEEHFSGQFIRCHRGFLINSSKILQIIFSRNTIVLEGEIEVPISRTYKSVLKAYGGGVVSGT